MGPCAQLHAGSARNGLVAGRPSALEDSTMARKVVLCNNKDCCPAVEVLEDRVLIGEAGNLCVLKPEEWDDLKAKVLSGQL